MAVSNLDLAVRIRIDLQNALRGFDRLERRLGGAGLAADKGLSPRVRGNPYP